jgi:hypothetical protein
MAPPPFVGHEPTSGRLAITPFPPRALCTALRRSRLSRKTRCLGTWLRRSMGEGTGDSLPQTPLPLGDMIVEKFARRDHGPRYDACDSLMFSRTQLAWRAEQLLADRLQRPDTLRIRTSGTQGRRWTARRKCVSYRVAPYSCSFGDRHLGNRQVRTSARSSVGVLQRYDATKYHSSVGLSVSPHRFIIFNVSHLYPSPVSDTIRW